MEQFGTVSEIKGKYAEVVIKKESSCGDNCASCGMCDTSKMRKVLVLNECDAEKGDRVKIYLESCKTVILSLVTYILPLIIFFVSFVFVKNELALTLIFISAFLICAFISNLLAKCKSFRSKMEKTETIQNDN